ncbi:MAG: rhodanese-related sulfurtransferase, partial [Psychroserpens sp.]
MKEYSVQELKSALDAGKELQLIDIREPWEI